MLSENTNSRMAVSFTAVISLYALGFWLFHMSAVSVSRKMKIITNVEFLKIEKPVVPVLTAPPEPAKTVLTAPAKALPAANEHKANSEMPLDAKSEPIKKAAPRVNIQEPEILQERKEPVQKLPVVRIEELKRERDAKINDLMDMSKNKGERVQKLIVQEQSLTERPMPLPRAGSSMGKTAALEEVGTQRVSSAKITDIAQPAAAARKNVIQDSPGDTSPLIEKKRMLKMQLAALGSQSTPLPDAQQAPRRDNITDITGSLKERQKAKEIVELQKIIDSQEPAPAKRDRPVKSGLAALGGSNAPEKISDKQASALKELPAESRVPEIPIKKPRALEESETVQEVKKSSLDISGPLKQRKLISSSTPRYPEWARIKGIEADVLLKFYVNPRGYVTSDITLVRTSGYRELDMLSIEALKKWVFAPLGKNEPQQDQWGAVTIRYILE